MAKFRVKLKHLAAFILLILVIILAYFLVSIEVNNISTTTLPKVTTVPITTEPPTTSTLPSTKKSLLGLVNENIQDECNVTYTKLEKKHAPTSRWFYDLCSNFKDYNETEVWRADAYLNGNCDLAVENGCIEVLTSISLDEKLICVWGIDHFSTKMLPFENITQKYC